MVSFYKAHSEEVSLTSSLVQSLPPLVESVDAFAGVLRFPPVLVEVVSARSVEGVEAVEAEPPRV